MNKSEQVTAPVSIAAARRAARGKPTETAQEAPQVEAETTKGRATRRAPAVKEKAPQLLSLRATPGKPIHVISVGVRPGSGAKLAAHTHAALTVMGMLEPSRPAVPRTAVLAVIGQRAVQWHTKKGNMMDAPDGKLRLTEVGYNFFTERATSGAVRVPLANAYQLLFTKGKLDATLELQASNVYALASGL